MPSHFDGDHPAKRKATHETRPARIDSLGHTPGIAREVVAWLGSTPTRQDQIGELLALEPENPFIGSHS